MLFSIRNSAMAHYRITVSTKWFDLILQLKGAAACMQPVTFLFCHTDTFRLIHGYTVLSSSHIWIKRKMRFPCTHSRRWQGTVPSIHYEQSSLSTFKLHLNSYIISNCPKHIWHAVRWLKSTTDYSLFHCEENTGLKRRQKGSNNSWYKCLPKEHSGYFFF